MLLHRCRRGTHSWAVVRIPLEISRRALAEEGAMGELSVSRSHAGAVPRVPIRAGVNPCDGRAAEPCGICGAASDVVPVLVPDRYPNGAYSVRPSGGTTQL